MPESRIMNQRPDTAAWHQSGRNDRGPQAEKQEPYTQMYRAPVQWTEELILIFIRL